MEFSDAQIAQHLQSGNKEVMVMIFHHFKIPVLNFCIRILGNRADAEDVTGDVFFTLLTKNYSYQPQAKFSTWLFTIARNFCITRIRKRKNLVSMWFTSAQSERVDAWDVPDSNSNSREILEDKETSRHIKIAISKLPLEQKEAIVLREYHNLSYEEIGQILDCSLEKVKILIFRGREQLRVELASFIKGAQND